MPDEGVTAWEDVVLGRIEYPNEKLEDVVLVRSDGRPTYNFVSPLEDALDAITHVIRGQDHVSNTPKQLRILEAIGAELPAYAHVPLLNGADGRKLSKRHGAITVEEFRAQGYLPDALVNYLALLGWSYDDHTEIMSRAELVERFTLDRVGTSAATFDYKKLEWLNGMYLRALPPDAYADALVRYLREQGYEWDEDVIRKAAPLVQEKIATLGEFPAFAGFLFARGRARSGEARRRADAPGRRGAPGRGGALRGGRDRGGATRCGRGARPEAARGFSADPSRPHRLAGLAGPVREPRAPWQGRIPRSPDGQRPRPRERVERPLKRQPGAPPKEGRGLRQHGGCDYHFQVVNASSARTDTALWSVPRMGKDAQLPTVLVVDDEPSLRLVCRVNLELDGYRVLEAPNVAEAEQILLADSVDVVLLDVHVGPDSGIELMRRLRERGGAPPVVLVTGSARLDEETNAEADGVVAKPFRLEELLEVVRRLTAA